MQGWQLCLFGKFGLKTPEGEAVVLPTRKAEALIAVLAINRKYGIGRDELAQILWPSSSFEKRRDNLRQALTFVRKALGHDNVEQTRTHCRLAEGFPLWTDYDEPSLRTGKAFLPGFEGDWFEAIRLESEIEEEEAPMAASPVAGLSNLLTWYAEHDPPKMLGIMRENVGMVVGMKCDDVAGLLGRIGEQSEHRGWKAYFDGYLMMRRGSLAIGVRQLRDAIAVAQRENDNFLAVQAATQVCAAACYQGRFAEAIQASKWCSEIAASSKNARLTPTATHLRGWVLIQSGELEKGVQGLSMAEQQYREYLDFLEMKAYQGMFLAAVGQCDRAENMIQYPAKVAEETGHMYLKVICTLTRAVNRLYAGPPADAVAGLEQAVQVSETYANKQLVISAREALAKAFLRSGDQASAKAQMQHARKLRIAMSAAYTPFDKIWLES